MHLHMRFSLVFVAVFAIGFGVAASLFHGLLQRNAREQVLYNAQLMMETALAVRSYTLDQVKPAVAGDPDGQSAQGRQPGDEVFRELCAKRGLAGKRVFRPQTVPAFAATELFAQLRKNYPDYMCKEAAPNPTNPRDRALEWEEDIIRAFRNHPEMRTVDGERDTPVGRSLFLARPLRAPKDCLECHSTPGNAPPEMLSAYGTANGFGWTEGDVIAAQIVSVPVALPVQMANHAFLRLLVLLFLVGLLTLVVLNAMLYVTVIRPVSMIARRADEISQGNLQVPELQVRGKDEISILAGAFNRMHRSVTAAVRLLEDETESPPRPDQG
ncbi:MAG TPA: DUF3365 domain-containing protein [Anaeromyxobacteraceae bacterium]|nr:DUF3365 domain-containing protein [Anaeromyxobacteraceae bacterium]